MEKVLRLVIHLARNHRSVAVPMADGRTISIGGEHCSITIKDATLASKQLTLTRCGERLIAQDAGIGNKMLINSLETQTSPVSSGDIIEFGRYRIVVIGLEERETTIASVAVPETNLNPSRGELMIIEQPRPLEQKTDLARPGLVTQEQDLAGQSTRTHSFDEITSQIDPSAMSAPVFTSAISIETSPFTFLKNNRFSFYNLLKFFVRALLHLPTFWSELPLHGNTAGSILVIAVCSILVAFFQTVGFWVVQTTTSMNVLLTNGLQLLLITTLGFITSSVIVSTMHHLFRHWLSAKGEFGSYLQFVAYAAVVAVPAMLIEAISKPIGHIAQLIVGIWILFGFVQIYRPRIVRMIALWTGSFAVITAALSPILLQRLNSQKPFHYSTTTAHKTAKHATSPSIPKAIKATPPTVNSSIATTDDAEQILRDLPSLD